MTIQSDGREKNMGVFSREGVIILLLYDNNLSLGSQLVTKMIKPPPNKTHTKVECGCNKRQSLSDR